MTQEQHIKLANHFYAAYLAEKEKLVPDEFMVRYFQEMYLYHQAHIK